jgi:selenoprotein W-related protein
VAAELEAQFDANCRLVQSSGGVFEVEHEGKLIFSKKALSRFPEDGEIANIVRALSEGKPLAEAQAQAAKDIPPPLSFADWLQNFFVKQSRKY